MENKNTKYLHNKKNSFNFATSKGALAHLARAFDWQSRGGRFESDMLHKILTDWESIFSWFPILLCESSELVGMVLFTYYLY